MIIRTEKQAKRYVCPFRATATSGKLKMCLASSCFMWRWMGESQDDEPRVRYGTCGVMRK